MLTLDEALLMGAKVLTLSGRHVRTILWGLECPEPDTLVHVKPFVHASFLTLKACLFVRCVDSLAYVRVGKDLVINVAAARVVIPID